MSGSYLSPEGRRRKAEMRSLLQGAVVVRRRRRRAVRVVVGLVLIGLAVFLSWPPADRSFGLEMVHDQSVPRFEHFEFEVVHGDAERVADWVVPEADVLRFYVGDDSLSGLLDESGHDPGFMRVGSDVVLMTPVADDFPDGK